tara:strand:- start:833 stop:1078 length:246 start_codon:yes stop_codon:yes gene_type:complete
MNLDDETDFRLPTEWVDKIYELSGGAEKYKGILMALSSEQGDPLIYFKYDSGMTEAALTKTMTDYLRNLDNVRSNEEEDDL